MDEGGKTCCFLLGNKLNNNESQNMAQNATNGLVIGLPSFKVALFCFKQTKNVDSWDSCH